MSVFIRKIKVSYVWTLAIASGIISIIILLFILKYPPKLIYFIPTNKDFNMTLGISMLLIVGPVGISEYLKYRYIRGVERSLAPVLRDISEGVGAGLSLVRAFELASLRRKGPIGHELKLLITKINLGVTLEEALDFMGKRLMTPKVLRFVAIIKEANRSGGRMKEVLDSASELYNTMNLYEEEKRSETRQYILIIYIAFGIFIIIAYVLLKQLIGPLTVMAKEMTGVLPVTVLEPEFYSATFFYTSLVQSITGGMLAGKISEESNKPGLLHSTILLILTLIFFWVIV